MLSHRASASYSQQCVEKLHAGSKDALPSPNQLLTDRTSYIAYLESQLERVAAACLTVQSFDERLEQAVSAIRSLEEKTLNLARLVSVAQQYAEQQEAAQREGAADLARRLRGVEGRLAELEQPERAAEWESRLRAVSSQVDSRLAEISATSEARLAEAAGRLQAGLEASCHEAHVAMETRLGEAAGRVTEAERKLRAVNEFVHKADTSAAVADLAGRLGGVEDSVAHLAASDSGMKGSLTSLQSAVAQLKTAVVALELRPPLGGAAAEASDCLQWLERAREALRREVTDIQQQHGYLASGLSSAAAAAAAAPASPQKVLAAQVLGGLSYSMRQEVGKELQALQLVDQLLDSVASQLKPSTVATGGSAATSQSPSGPAGSAAAATKAAGTGTDGDGGSGWTIAAAPAASASDAPGLQQQRISQLAYPPVPSSQQAVAAAAGGALAQLQQLAGGEQQLVQAAAALAAASGSTAGGGGSGGSNLRSTFAQMQQTLASVCELLQQDGGQASPRYAPSEAACQAATSRYLSRSNTALAAPRPSSPSNGQPKRTWMPGGSCRLGAGAAAAAVAATSGAAKEALRESVLGQAALEQRQRRLQQLYSELRQ